MIDIILNAINNEPMVQTALIATLTLIVGGVVGYLLRDLPIRIINNIITIFTIKLTVDDSNYARTELFNRTTLVVADNVIRWASRTISGSAYYGDTSSGYNKISGTSIGYGSHLCVFDGAVMVATRQKVDSGTNPYDKIMISTMIWNRQHIMGLLDVAKGKRDNTPKVFINYGDGWRKTGDVSGSKLDDLVLDDSFRDKIKNEIGNFFCLESITPKKLTVLLHGLPGTGKTGLIRSIAKQYSRCVYVINLSSMDDRKIFDAINTVPKGSIILMEDCDCVIATTSRGAESNSEKIPLTLGGILNSLDGIQPIEDCMVFMTTNHLENLDMALTRKARVDITMEVPMVSGATVSKAMMNDYGIAVDDTQTYKGCDIFEMQRTATYKL